MITKTLLAGALTLALAPAALAHSFNVAMVVPANTPQEQRAAMTSAFLLASEERDSHANEESDGHLGGLDVYFTLAGENETARLADARADIVIRMDGADVPPTGAVVFTPLPAHTPGATAFLARPAGSGLPPFAARYTARTGTAPGSGATLTYIAARQIARAVRAQEGTGNPAALLRAINGN